MRDYQKCTTSSSPRTVQMHPNLDFLSLAQSPTFLESSDKQLAHRYHRRFTRSLIIAIDPVSMLVWEHAKCLKTNAGYLELVGLIWLCSVRGELMLRVQTGRWRYCMGREVSTLPTKPRRGHKCAWPIFIPFQKGLCFLSGLQFSRNNPSPDS